MELILEKLKRCKYRDSTVANYHAIWRQFNRFVMRLDKKPKFWENRATLFGVALVQDGLQSSTLKSYMSAIKNVLLDDGYPWDNNRVLVNTLTKACHMVNDSCRTRLLIHKNLLEQVIFELGRKFNTQPFLHVMYRAFFLLSYYGLFRIGELAKGDHVVKARDVHIGQNKNKMLFILYSSMTHHKGSRPQKIKIEEKTKYDKSIFCPFKASREYLAIHGNYLSDTDQFFVHSDNRPVTPENVRRTLKLYFHLTLMRLFTIVIVLELVGVQTWSNMVPQLKRSEL